MEFGIYSIYQTSAIKRISGISFYISLYFPWNMWNAMYRVFRKALRLISMLHPTVVALRERRRAILKDCNFCHISPGHKMLSDSFQVVPPCRGLVHQTRHQFHEPWERNHVCLWLPSSNVHPLGLWQDYPVGTLYFVAEQRFCHSIPVLIAT